MKKFMVALTSSALILFQITAVFALDVPYEGNESTWLAHCSQANLPAGEEASCDDFIDYMANKSSSLKDKLEQLEARRAEIEENILQYTEQIRGYQSEINVIQTRINTLTANITQKEEEITQKQMEIDIKQEEVDKLYATFRERMITSQTSMRLNIYVDLIMGAKDFEDLIRRSTGIKLITDHDQHMKDTLKLLIEQLEVDKVALTELKISLEEDREELKDAMDDIIIKKLEAEIIKERYLKEEAELEAEGNKIAGDLSAVNDIINKIIDDIGKIPSSGGFTRPVSSQNGYLSAGTWYYPGGGLHLGADYASYGGLKGAPIRAAGNGVVVFSADGCGDGYLGASCGNGGTSGGGNQVYLITKIGDSVYGIRYLHMLAGTPVQTGTKVTGGDTIGGIGTSGNSSGPHVHVEVIYLGTGSLSDHVTAWLANGSLSFGAGFGYAALNRLCDNGSGAPCRIRPETLF